MALLIDSKPKFHVLANVATRAPRSGERSYQRERNYVNAYDDPATIRYRESLGSLNSGKDDAVR